MSMQPLSWVDQPFGNHPRLAWEEARQQCGGLLVAWARGERLGTYREVSQQVTAVSWPDGEAFRSQVGRLLGQVSYAEWLQDRPPLSALVVNADTGGPGTGFFELCRETLGMDMGQSDGARTAFWSQQVLRCFTYWRNA